MNWRPSEIEVNLPGDDVEWWVKVVGMLEHNWALPVLCPGGINILFVGDTSGVFDQMQFEEINAARQALDHNGFKEYASDLSLQKFILPPTLPLHEDWHDNGPIYSSGQYWFS